MKPFLNPAPFQGSLKKKHYFEGWYFKHVSADRKQVLSFIPGVSLSGMESHCFIQVIDGISGQTWYVSYPLDSFEGDKKKLYVRVGESIFSQDFCRLRIETDDVKIKGNLLYDQASLYPRSLGSPGIMGWFSYVPGMECRHDAISMNHSISGSILFNGRAVDFNNGLGYIEKDWGWNFPSSYVWIQCNHFDVPDISFMLAIAQIPLGPINFTGFLGFFYSGGDTRAFGTWNRWKLKSYDFTDSTKGVVELSGSGVRLLCRVEGKSDGSLKAPAMGAMSQVIKESVNSDLVLDYTDSRGHVSQFRGNPAGFELRGLLKS